MRSRYITIITAGVLSVLLCLPAAVSAAPQSTAAAAVGDQVVLPKTTEAILDANQASVTATGTFSYSVRIRPSAGADSISARFELFNQGDKSIFHRMKYWNFNTNDPTRAPAPTDQPDGEGAYAYTFNQDVSSLDLPPGDYAVRCTIKTSSPERIYTQQLASHLFVYDPAGTLVPAALVVRIGAPALQRTDGVFASDPATGTARLRAAELSQLSRWVLAQPKAQLTLASSPLLIKELADVTAGCHYIDKEGEKVELSANSPAAVAIGQSLDDLRAALATGRLKIAWQGYADPDVSALLEYRLTSDIATQYQQGKTTLNNILGVDPAPVTVPFGDSSVMQASKQLAPLGIKQVLPAGYNKVSQSLETSTAVAAQAQLFGQRDQAKATAVVVGLPINAVAASALVARIEALQDCPWMEFRTPDATALRSVIDDRGTQRQPLETPRPDFAPVYQARQAALGLASAVGAKDANAHKAAQFSLIAENAFGSRPASASADQDVESYAQAALRIVKKAFAPLSLKIHPVTLAGNSGEVPITVANSSGTQMQVHLEFVGKNDRIGVEPPASPLLTVAGNEALFSSKVTLHTVGASDLRVRLMAGQYAIREDNVAISGSYLDIIGIVAIVVIVGAGLVFYIWRHSKREQKGGARAC